MNQSAPLEELPEKYEEPDVSDVEAIPQRVLMQFIEELPEILQSRIDYYPLHPGS